MKKLIFYLFILSVLCFCGCGQMQEGVKEIAQKSGEDTQKDVEENEKVGENTKESEDGQGTEVEKEATFSTQSLAIINRVNNDLREGYEEVQLSYMNASDLGWHCYEQMWSSKEEREALAQAALKELYTFTGNNLTGCVYYCTNGCSSFAFAGSPEDMQKGKYIYCRDYGTELADKIIPGMSWTNGTPVPLEDLLGNKIANGEAQSHLEEILLQVLGKSGLYQGQKIENCEVVYVVDAENSRFYLNFDGGYYIVITDKTVQFLISVSGPYFEEEKELATPTYMREIIDKTYRNIITGIIEKNRFPISNYETDGLVYNQSYAVLDIDADGKEELIINYANANSMAGMVYYVYDYDRTTGEAYIECAGWPGADFLDNGYVKEDASHNHGRSNLDDFWPYHLLLYNPEEDVYESITHVDAWQKELYPKDFPEEADKDGDGIVYYTAPSSYVPTFFMDKEEYDKWCEQYNTGTPKMIQWKKIMTVEEYEAYMQSPKG